MPLVLIAFFQSLLFSFVLSQGVCKQTSSALLTFYGFPDAGSDQTSFSCGSRGNKAGGIGSFSNPETFATAQSNPNFKNCDIVYIPYFRKYFQYNDHCVQCDQDYNGNGITHLDLWIGDSTHSSITCERQLGSLTGQTVVQNPPSDLPVNLGALWDGSACHDASSSSPLIYPNPIIDGLCSGTSSTGSGSSNESEATPATPTSIVLQKPQNSFIPLATPTSSTSIHVAQLNALTTLVTSVSASASISPTTSTLIGGSSNTANCTSQGGCLGKFPLSR